MDQKVIFTYLGLIDKPTENEMIAMAIRAKERSKLITIRDKLGIPKLR